jgi:formamidopyrimidine-DNA glycosylase
MADRLGGKRVTALRRRSKYILADLDSGETLLVHLGMSGRMLVSGAAVGSSITTTRARRNMTMWSCDMDNGARITFNDARRFGAMDLMQTGRKTTRCWPGWGRSRWAMTSMNPTLPSAGRAATPVKTALLDQRIVAGLGNIYVCETLYRAGISPAAGRRPHEGPGACPCLR